MGQPFTIIAHKNVRDPAYNSGMDGTRYKKLNIEQRIILLNPGICGTKRYALIT